MRHVFFFGLRPALAGLAVLLLAGCGAGDSSSSRAGSDCRYAQVTEGLSEEDALLFTASGEGDVEKIKEAIRSGANPHAIDVLKRTPLAAAAFCNRQDAIETLLTLGSDIKLSDLHGFTALHDAVVTGSIDAAQALMAHGADVNAKSLAGRTPLHLAAATNQLTLVSLLLEGGAQTTRKDIDGLTPAALASRNGHKAVAELIRHWKTEHKS
jgi:ankyrin repeat protein